MKEIGDERLARRAANGDRRAFEQIYRRYNQDLYRFCLAMLGNQHDAQDTLQNAMVKVLRALPGEKREIKLKPWLYRIVRNEAVETLRRRRDLLEPAPEQVAPTASQIAERAEDRERLRLLLADLDELPGRQRAALVMRELSGLSFEEIAKAFETSPATARQAVYEARLSLSQMEAGREMDCEKVMRALSDADGRVTRRRDLRAHLRDCPTCRAFADGMDERRGELAAIAPLPLAASAGLLHSILAAQVNAAAGAGATAGAGGGGGIAGTIGVGATKGVATSAIVKSAATIAVASVVGLSVADRSGLINLPLATHHHSSTRSTARPDSPTGGDAAGGAGTAVSRNPDASGEPGGKSASPGRQGEEAGQTSNGGSAKAQGNAARPGGSSRSQAGLNPPGGGHGRSAAARHGRPDDLPAASGHGQETATAHKPAHAASPPGQSAAHRGHRKSGGRSSPPRKPASPPKAKAPAAASPPQPAAKAPSQGEGRDPQKHGAGTGLQG